MAEYRLYVDKGGEWQPIGIATSIHEDLDSLSRKTTDSSRGISFSCQATGFIKGRFTNYGIRLLTEIGIKYPETPNKRRRRLIREIIKR